MSDQDKFSILKRELDGARRKIWFSIILLWIIVFVTEFYLRLSGQESLFSFIIGPLLTTPIWYYYRKKEKQILNQMAKLKI